MLKNKRTYVFDTRDLSYAVTTLLVRTAVNRSDEHLRLRDGRRVQRRPTPGHVHRQPREIDDRAVATIATQIVSGAHEDAIDRARLDAQSAEHALRVVDCEARDLEALAPFDAFLAYVDAIDRAGLRALVAR